MGKPVIMGRKTFQSIGRPLPGRRSIVMTRNRGFSAEGCTVVHSVEEALAAGAGSEELLVIGGGQIYELFLPKAGRIYLTIIQAEFEGDAYFPAIDWSQWREICSETLLADERNPFAQRYMVLERLEATV